MDAPPPGLPSDDRPTTLDFFASAAPREAPGLVIGRYKLLQLIGEGGFGTVYMAEQLHPVRRTVALKIIKLGMDTRQVIARFEAERQALALMDHPNIARVLDAGATDAGRPYFVMELVRGVPITEYCDTNNLPTSERLTLFTHVCRAVQHAHQKGIIHRDLKPSNVLVTLHDASPVPKVIDFGIAKATQQRLTEMTLFTEYKQFVGTPEYMPPEQAEMSGLDVDTRSDVYSLGVLLYELLTGTTPFDSKDLRKAGYGEIQRIMREVEPPKPSTRLSTMGQTVAGVAARRRTDPRKLAASLRGELDWIVMKCLEKDRTRRYETANGLAQDIERHLRDEPVSASPPGLRYRFGKFARRNRVALASTAAVAGALVLGLALATFGLLRARTERDRAVIAEKDVSKLLAEATAARGDALNQLREARFNQARATRRTGQLGRRFDSLSALAEAARIRPSQDLIDEAIATLALVDLKIARQWTGPRSRLAFDVGFERYARSDPHGNISVRRLSDDHEIASLPSPAPDHSVGYVFRFSPDGRHLAVKYGASPWHLRVWDLHQKKTVYQIDSSPHAESVDFHPAGSSIALARPDDSLVLVDLSTGRETDLRQAQSNERFARIAFSPDGNSIAILRGISLRIQPLANGVIEHLKQPVHVELPRAPVHAITWSPDSQHIAAACGDHAVHICDARTGKPRSILRGHLSSPIRIQFTRRGDLIATSGWDGTVRLWDPITGGLLLTAPAANAELLQLSADDRFLAAGSADLTTLFHVAAPAEYRTLTQHPSPAAGLYSADLSPDARLIATGAFDGLRLFDAFSGRQLTHARIGETHSVSFSASGKEVVAGAATGLLHFPIRSTASDPNALELGTPKTLAPQSGRAAFAARDRQLLFHAAPDHALGFLDPAKPESIHLLGRHQDLAHLALSPDGKYAASATRHGTGVKVFDTATGRLLHDLAPNDGMAEVAFSPDGHWLVSGHMTHFRFWRLPEFTEAHRIDRHPGASLPALAFSADSRLLALAISNFAAQLRDPSTGRVIATLQAPDQHYLRALAFTADSTRLIAVSENHVIQLWDLRLLRQRLTTLGLSLDLPAPPAHSATRPAEGPVTLRVEPASPFPPRHAHAMAIARLTFHLRDKPGDARSLAQRGTLYARQAQFPQALADLLKATDLEPDEHWHWFQRGVLQLHLNQMDAYRDTCRQMLDRFASTTRRDTAERAAKLALLDPGQNIDRKLPLALLDKAMTPPVPPHLRPWFEGTKALANYRDRNTRTALDWINEARSGQLSPTGHALLHALHALCLHDLGESDSARKQLAAAADFLANIPSPGGPGYPPNGDYENWIIAQALLREAQSRIPAPAP